MYCKFFQLFGAKATTWQGYRFDMINEESSPEVEEYKTEFSSHQAAMEFLSVFSEVVIVFCSHHNKSIIQYILICTFRI